MKLLYVAPFVLVGCLGLEHDAPEQTSEIESESVPTSQQGTPGQGSHMQGSHMQGSHMQGSHMQGSHMQGSHMQGTFGGVAFSSGAISGTALRFTRHLSTSLSEVRYPDKICRFSGKMPQGCTTYALSQSPLLGSTWNTTFMKKNADGTYTTIPVTARIDAVRRDPTTAMHPLRGSSFATAATISCENPDGCRPNTDIFNYDVRITDVLDVNGNPEWLCPSGQTAIALPGRWTPSDNYNHAPSSSFFTFACTNGVIAKCTRWGYRPYDVGIRENDQHNTVVSLQPYHQACIRAASADYCGTGKSMTKDGTWVDIYDYMYNGSLPDGWTHAGGVGFIPRLDGFIYPDHRTVSAFAMEGHFDGSGGVLIDHARYQELQQQGLSIEENCPGRFYQSQEFFPYTYTGNQTNPLVRIDSAPGCSHSEYKTGKYLHPSCSECTDSAPPECNDPANGWTQACVDWAKAHDDTTYQPCYGSDRMALHSECETGSPLFKYDTGCTLTVCSMYPHCCSSTWDQTCVNAAHASCTGGGEGRVGRGFCSDPIVIAPPPGGNTF